MKGIQKKNSNINSISKYGNMLYAVQYVRMWDNYERNYHKPKR